MTLVIDLAPSIEERLREEAARCGVNASEYARHLIEKGLPVPLNDKQKAAVTLLQTWIDEDATDDPKEIERAEGELRAFKKAMNENRFGERPLYL
jgi:hypothetical protein